MSQIEFPGLEKEVKYDRLKPVIIVTIGLGKGANPEILKKIADLGRGFFEPATPGQLERVIAKVAAIGVAGPQEPEPKVSSTQSQAPR